MNIRHIHQEPELKEWLGIFEYVCERVRVGEENCIKFYIYSKDRDITKLIYMQSIRTSGLFCEYQTERC